VRDKRKAIMVAEPVHRILKAYSIWKGITIGGMITALAESCLAQMRQEAPEIYQALAEKKNPEFKVNIGGKNDGMD